MDDLLSILSPTYRKNSRPGTLQKRALIAPHLPTGGSISRKKDAGSRGILAKLAAQGHQDVTKDDILDYSAIMGRVDRYLQDKKFQQEIDAAIASGDKKHFTARDRGLLAFIRDNPEIKTREAAEKKIRALSPAPPSESEPLPEKTDNISKQTCGTKTPIVVHTLDILALVVQDIIASGQIIHCTVTVDAMREEIAHLEKRIAANERENHALKEKCTNYAQRLLDIEEALTADPVRLAEIRSGAKRLKRDVVEGLPQYTEKGGYWKESLPVIYRRGFRKTLADRGLRDKDHEAIVEVIGKIITDPFYPGLETEIRRNGDNGNASMIKGITRGAPYYYSRVGGHRRIIYAIEGDGGNKKLHFVETNPKENYTYA